jgi:hypothetical protein
MLMSGHRASFLVSCAASCGSGLSLARPAGPGNTVLLPSGWPS